ncbi:sulfurtransferase-like selenium metabolism protein YedF [Fundidesulfovibrio butyratiphilus]
MTTSVTTVDCLGMTCPQPLMECNKILSQGTPQNMRVLVSDQAALENVTRFLTSSGYSVTSSGQADRWTIEAALTDPQARSAKPEDFPCPLPNSGPRSGEKVVVFLSSEFLGKGDDILGGKLMGNFLKTLPELGDDLFRLIMVNGSVRLSTAEHPNFPAVKALEDSGVTVLVCGTCLEFFGLLSSRAVGQTTNMLDVVTSLQLASKVITL